MREHEHPIEDGLLSACLEFIHVASMTGNMEENSLSKRFSAIVALWRVRYRNSKDPNFPSIKDYIPRKQWEESTIVYRHQQLQFVGALADYIKSSREV